MHAGGAYTTAETGREKKKGDIVGHFQEVMSWKERVARVSTATQRRAGDQERVSGRTGRVPSPGVKGRQSGRDRHKGGEDKESVCRPVGRRKNHLFPLRGRGTGKDKGLDPGQKGAPRIRRVFRLEGAGERGGKARRCQNQQKRSRSICGAALAGGLLVSKKTGRANPAGAERHPIPGGTRLRTKAKDRRRGRGKRCGARERKAAFPWRGKM